MSVSTRVRLEPIDAPMRLGVPLPPEQHEVLLPIDDESPISSTQPLGLSTVCTVRNNLSTGEPVVFQIAVTPEMTARDVFRLVAHGYGEKTKETLAPFDLADIDVTNCRMIRIGVGLRKLEQEK